MTPEENLCRECGEPSDFELASCAGAEAEERAQNVNLAVTGTQRLMSCNCCEKCRAKCEQSWHEENP
jgi:hypothetical protein